MLKGKRAAAAGPKKTKKILMTLTHSPGPPISRRTNSTIWPESMTRKLPTDAALRSPQSPSAEPSLRRGSAEIAQASRALLGELEASLQASQNALLAHDVTRLEERTCEQIGLRRSLDILWDAAHPPGSDPAQHDLRLSAELRAAQMRVLRLGRVQAALLGRAQRWLRMVSNLLAGPEASYAPPTFARMAQYPAWPPPSSGPRDNTRTRQEQERDPCRA